MSSGEEQPQATVIVCLPYFYDKDHYVRRSEPSSICCSLLEKGVCGVAGSLNWGGSCPPLCGQWTNPFFGRKGVQRLSRLGKEPQLSWERQLSMSPLLCCICCSCCQSQALRLCRGRLEVFSTQFPSLARTEQKGRRVSSTLCSGRRLAAPGNGRWFCCANVSLSCRWIFFWTATFWGNKTGLTGGNICYSDGVGIHYLLPPFLKQLRQF